jgi:hypothetical protein
MPREMKEGARNFGAFLAQVEHGGLVAELSNAQHQLVDDLQEHAATHSKAKGSLTLTLNYEHDAFGKVLIRSSVKTKAPQRTAEATVFWTDKEGQLVNQDPKQTKLEFKDVSSPKAREAAAEGGVGIPRAV